MTIAFNSIPVGIQVPGQYVEFDSSQAGTSTQVRRMLVIGHVASGGSASPGEAVRVDNASAVAGLFGQGSQVGTMARVAKAAHRLGEVWALPLADASGAAKASASIVVEATSAQAGTIALYIAGQRVAVGVQASADANTIATAIQTACNQASPALPVVATVSTNTLTLTCRWGGTTGNQIDLRHSYLQAQALPSGVTLALTAFTGGATDPNLTSALAALGDTQYHSLAMPYHERAALSALDSVLQTRWGPLEAKEGVAFIPAVGTLSAMTTLGEACNSQLICLVGVGKSPSAPWSWAATTAAVSEREAALDPARPLQTLLLPGVLPPNDGTTLDYTERNTALKKGVSTTTTQAGKVRIERLVTPYATNPAGAADGAYHDLTVVRILAFLRSSLQRRIALKYPRHKLANDGATGDNVVTPSTLKAEIVALFTQWEAAGLVENPEAFIKGLRIERDSTDQNRINASLPPDIINGLRVLAAKIEFRL